MPLQLTRFLLSFLVILGLFAGQLPSASASPEQAAAAQTYPDLVVSDTRTIGPGVLNYNSLTVQGNARLTIAGRTTINVPNGVIIKDTAIVYVKGATDGDLNTRGVVRSPFLARNNYAS